MQCDERGCSANVAVAVAGPWATARMQRELLYRCNSGSGRTMCSSTECSRAEDVGQGGLASTPRSMLDDQGDTR